MSFRKSILSLGLFSTLLCPTEMVLAQNFPYPLAYPRSAGVNAGFYPQPYAYPLNNQAPTQVQQDHYACYNQARQQSGVDPTGLSPGTLFQSSQQGSLLQGAVQGALMGVVGGAIDGGKVGTGSAMGAGIGALDGLFQSGGGQSLLGNSSQVPQLQSYYNNWTPCMQARGYSRLNPAQNLYPEPFAYPTNGQSPEQQQADHLTCANWAQQQTGIDPNQLSPVTIASSSQQGSVLQGALQGAFQGALMGVVGGAIDGGHIGKGAEIGAGVGALRGLLNAGTAQRQANQYQAEVDASEQAQLQTYNRAWATCMQGQGYNVN